MQNQYKPKWRICLISVCSHTLNHSQTIKRTIKPFMTKTLSKSITERTHLRNTFLKNPIIANKLAYTKQRKFCISLLAKVKREYFSNLNESNITDNRKFWQNIKPFLSEKNKSWEKDNFGKN